MIDPKIYRIYEDIEHISKSRQKNWKTPDAPEDEELEKSHLAQIAKLKEDLATYGDTQT